MAERHIVIGTDSRFRGLEDYLLSNPITGSSTTSVNTLPGGRLLSVYNSVKTTVLAIKKKSSLPSRPFSLTISAGICDLTSKIRHEGGQELCYPASQLDSVTSTLDLISSLSLTELNAPVKFSTIPPSNMAKYRDHMFRQHKLTSSVFTDELLQMQQKLLEEDITKINNYIYQLNDKQNVRTIRLEKNVTKSSVKIRGRNNGNKKTVRSYIYDKLYDGVHACPTLQQEWFFFLSKSIYNDLISNSSPTDFVAEDENQTCDTWDYKRL